MRKVGKKERKAIYELILTILNSEKCWEHINLCAILRIISNKFLIFYKYDIKSFPELVKLKTNDSELYGTWWWNSSTGNDELYGICEGLTNKEIRIVVIEHALEMLENNECK